MSNTGNFTDEQKQYLAGFMAGAMQRGAMPFVGTTPKLITHDPATDGGLTPEVATEYVKKLTKDKRSQRDVY